MVNVRYRLEFANILRGAAALIVVLFAHFGGVFFASKDAVVSLIYSSSNTYGWYEMPKFFQIIHLFGINYGHLGVALFFLISGFVIPFSIERFSRIQFLIARFFRIWPTYMVGLSCSLIGLCISIWYFDVTWPYDIRQILYQILLIRDIFWVPSIDGVSWTLEIEIKFYLISALFLFYCYRKTKIIILLCFVTLLAFAVVIMTADVGLKYMLEMDLVFITYMLIGTVFNFHHRRGISTLKLLSSVILIFILFATEWKYSFLSNGYFEGVKNYGLALIIFFIFYMARFKIKTNKILDFFADISYPMYIVHPIIGYTFMSIFLKKYPAFSTLAIIFAFMISIALSYFIHIFVERKTNDFGKKLANKMAA